VQGADERLTGIIRRHLEAYEVVSVQDERELRELEQRTPVDALLVLSEHPGGLVPPHSPGGGGRPTIHCRVRSRPALAQEPGVVAYLAKPVTADQLRAVLRRVPRVRKVLVVEDDADMRGLLVRMVGSLGRRYRVTAAANGADGLARARHERPDLVLLDLLLPELDGRGFIDAIRADAELRDVPVVVITARGYEPEAIVANDLLISRPDGFAIGDLTRILGTALGRLAVGSVRDAAILGRNVTR
jgi:CheY-like chemotaxis protein